MESIGSKLRNAALGLLFVSLLLLAFGFAGACDYEDERAEQAYWAERGIELERGW